MHIRRGIKGAANDEKRQKVDVLTSFFTNQKKTKKVRGKKEADSTYDYKYYIAHSTSFVAGLRRPETTEFL